MTALSVAMADGPRVVDGGRGRPGGGGGDADADRAGGGAGAAREHAIAQQLQDALQPAVPDHVLGWRWAASPACTRGGAVGGDFYDVFPLDKELHALVIGDVSGKGLAAAQQLALIRNSLRTTLYLYRAPAQAAAGLNAIVTSHDLLIGFVTAWVGVYDAATGRDHLLLVRA